MYIIKSINTHLFQQTLYGSKLRLQKSLFRIWIIQFCVVEIFIPLSRQETRNYVPRNTKVRSVPYSLIIPCSCSDVASNSYSLPHLLLSIMPAFTERKQWSFLEYDIAKLFVMTDNWLRNFYDIAKLFVMTDNWLRNFYDIAKLFVMTDNWLRHFYAIAKLFVMTDNWLRHFYAIAKLFVMTDNWLRHFYDIAKLFVMTDNWLRHFYAIGPPTEDQTVFV